MSDKDERETMALGPTMASIPPPEETRTELEEHAHLGHQETILSHKTGPVTPAQGAGAAETMLSKPALEQATIRKAPVVHPKDVLTAPHLPESDEMRTVARVRRASTTDETRVSARIESSANFDAEVGRVLAGKYKLLRQLGAGGMGKVFGGQHLTLDVPIAVKTMHPAVAAMPDYVRRFQREAHAASILNHPNVVRVLDFGDDGGLLFLVMEYIEGPSLGQWLRQRRTPPKLSEVAELLSMLFDAFQAAHTHGIVHRDLKPENILITELGNKPFLKVVDFGLAHVENAPDGGPTLTSTDMIAGTPEYMSPEQCRSLVVGPSADLYSIGCVLTTLLQLRPPFSARSPVDVMAKHMFSPPPPLSRPPTAEPVPPLLERLRLSLLAKNPDMRPKDAAEAKARLLEAMSPEASEAKLPSRKEGALLGDREARAPSWERVEPAVKTRREGRSQAALLRLVPRGAGLEEASETALMAQQIDLVEMEDDAIPEGSRVIVMDAGEAIDEACARIQSLKARTSDIGVVVCAKGLNSERMNALVAAGASDVVRYPVSPDVLAKKVTRVLRRGR